MVQSTLSEWVKSPIFGTGTGDTSYQLTGDVGLKQYPHNIYLEILSELGIVGFIFYIGLFLHTVPVFKAAFSYKQDDLIQRDYLVVLAAGLAYHILFGVKTGSYAGSFMLYFFMGASIGMRRVALAEYQKLSLNEFEGYMAEGYTYV
jgi:Kef-type K+ transport system membrane component KefB